MSTTEADEKELRKIIVRVQGKQYDDEETLSTVADRAYLLGRETGNRETASHRHAALLAAGIHGGPGAWRWAFDPTGAILDDEAAWERLLGEMRDLGSVEALRKLRWSVVANAGRLSRRGPAPRWAHVMSAAGLGSTSAKDLCVAAGFDPDEEIGSWPEPCETCAEEEGDEESEDE